MPHSFSVICRNVSSTFVELSLETPYWCTVLVHQYGRRKSTKKSGVHFLYKSPFFLFLTYVRKTCLLILEMVMLLKINRSDVFQRDSIPIFVSRTLKTRKFKLLYFRNGTCYGIGSLQKDLFFIYLQPSVNKNSQNLAVLTLQFHDVNMKTIFSKTMDSGFRVL